MGLPDMVQVPKAGSATTARQKIRRYAVAAACLAVLGYLPCGLIVWYACPPLGYWLMSLYNNLLLDKGPLLADVIFAPFYLPWTLASLMPASRCLLLLRRNGTEIANSGGSQSLLIWSWYACVIAVCFAIVRLAQLLLIRSYVIIY